MFVPILLKPFLGFLVLSKRPRLNVRTLLSDTSVWVLALLKKSQKQFLYWSLQLMQLPIQFL